MSFGGAPPVSIPPSGPFEHRMAAIASSPYMLAAAIFLLNIGGRFLPFEITRKQEEFLNQPWFRRLIIFVIFFVATRNLLIAIWLSLVMILLIGYLFNENSSLYIFGKQADTSSSKTTGDTIALTPEEKNILKALTDKSEKVKAASAKPMELGGQGETSKHTKYNQVMTHLWSK